MRRLLNRWRFFATFLRDRQVASLTPTSRSAVVALCRVLDFNRPLTVVELGPGSGVFTAYLLSRLPPGSRLVAIEQNAAFAHALEQLFPDPRLVVVQGTAQQLSAILSTHRLRQVDVVLSGIPLSFLPAAAQRAILRQVVGVLGADGLFLVYQFSSQVERWLKLEFPRVEHFRWWWNLPPLLCYVAYASDRTPSAGHPTNRAVVNIDASPSAR